MPTRLDIQAIENDPRFLKLWERPRFIGKPAHEDKPMGVNIATPQGKWHVHIRWIPNPDEPGANYPPPWILNLGDGGGWTVHFDDIQFYAGLEKLKQDGGLNMNIEGNYLFLFSIDPNVLEDAKNVGFGLRFHLKDDDGNDVVYDHLGEHGAIELFPRYNGVDHEGVYGLLVHVPEPWRVQSVGLIVDGRWASVEGEVDYWYFNCILAPDDFRVDYPIIEIPRLGEEPAPEPGPEPTPDPEPEPEPDGDSWGSLFDQLLGILRKIFDWCFAFFW